MSGASEEKTARVIQGKLKLNSTVDAFARSDEFEDTPKNSWEPIDAAIYDVRYRFRSLWCSFRLLSASCPSVSWS